MKKILLSTIVVYALTISTKASAQNSELLADKNAKTKTVSAIKWNPIAITPEKVTTYINVTVPSKLSEKSHLNIYNEVGDLVLQLDAAKLPVNARIELPSTMKKGIYLVEITNENSPMVQTFKIN